jgi:hypothetical protein
MNNSNSKNSILFQKIKSDDSKVDWEILVDLKDQKLLEKKITT